MIAVFAIGVPALLGVSFLAAWGIQRAGKSLSKAAAEVASEARSSPGVRAGSTAHPVDPSAQSEAEAILARAAAGDEAAAQQALSEAKGWTGRTQRTARTDQLVTACLNSGSFGVRGAGVAAELALEDISPNETGFARMEQAVGNPNQRAWALWMLGALANRGVHPVHAAKVIESYLTDPDVRARATAVDALALVGSSETVAMLLDRFRNDPSPVVQERAVCDLSQAGMYTRAQRMRAARTLVGWVGDASLSAQQRAWAVQALSDIAGKSFGSSPSAWQAWYNQQSSFE